MIDLIYEEELRRQRKEVMNMETKKETHDVFMTGLKAMKPLEPGKLGARSVGPCKSKVIVPEK